MQKSPKLGRSLDLVALVLGIGIILALRAYSDDPIVQLPETAQQDPAAVAPTEMAAGAVQAH